MLTDVINPTHEGKESKRHTIFNHFTFFYEMRPYLKLGYLFYVMKKLMIHEEILSKQQTTKQRTFFTS